MFCDAWRFFAQTVGVPCYQNKTYCHMYTICILYFIQYYVLHCIDHALKINVSELCFLKTVFLMFLFVVDVVHASSKFLFSVIKVLIKKWAT